MDGNIAGWSSEIEMNFLFLLLTYGKKTGSSQHEAKKSNDADNSS